jgi:hypothetical protein
MLMHKIGRAGLVLAMVVTLLMAAAPAQADSSDNGNGRVTCDRGEICFSFSWTGFTTSTFQRHFWYGNWDHWNQLYHNQPYCCSPALANTAGGFWNRDTQCYVRLWYYDGGVWSWYNQFPREYMTQLTPSMNEAHSRCG